MINVSSIAKPSTFVRKKAGFTDKLYFGLFCIKLKKVDS